MSAGTTQNRLLFSLGAVQPDLTRFFVLILNGKKIQPFLLAITDER